jgi:oxygen-independent coproporphyrinogen-3 oxidase
MTQCLLHEINLQKDFLGDETVESIYFGGGTPSILPESAIQQLIDQVRKVFKVADTIECTLEANPDDITALKIKSYAAMGINRLSIGIQSFFDDDLQFMNRAHDRLQAFECIRLAKENGISNISADLIFGFPLLTDEKWKQNIDNMLQLNIPHISCYAMTVEPKTALASMIKKQKTKPLDDEVSARQYEYLMQRLMHAGYAHYEISNFALPGFEAKHNSSYWNDSSYLGIGPSAHSYNKQTRRWNVANNALYIAQIQKNILPYEEEILSSTDKINELIMVSIRQSRGLDLSLLSAKLNQSALKQFMNKVNKWQNQQMLFIHNDHMICLTTKGKLFADGIASDLFF